MFRAKSLLLLIGILLLNIDFLLSYPAFADEITGSDKTTITSSFNSDGFRASNPDCGAFKTAAAIAGITFAVSALFALIVISVSSLGLFSGIAIVVAISAVVGVWKVIGGLVICQHSFVKHPVARDYEGNYQDYKLKESTYEQCTDENYAKLEDYSQCLKEKWGLESDVKILDIDEKIGTDRYYWPKNRVQYSEYIEICHRKPLSFHLPYMLGGRSKEPPSGFDIREKEIGYVTSSPWKETAGDFVCRSLKQGTEGTIHKAKFKAVRRGGKLCVEISDTGVGSPWPSGVNIGCTDLPPTDPAPMCKESKIIFTSTKDEPIDNIEGDPIGSEKNYEEIIKERKKRGEFFRGYNNKGCFKEYISEACYNQAGSSSLTPVPITSMVVQCIKESLDNLVAGTGVQGKGSFLFVAQEKLKNTITAVLVLALTLFSIKVIAGGVRQPQEMYMLIIKFALVLFFTTSGTMGKYYGYLTTLSNGLSEIVLKASSVSKGICDYKSTDYITSSGNYSYLAPWDRLDCRMLFYLGAPMHGIAGKIGVDGVATFGVLLGSSGILAVVGGILGVIFAGGQILVATVSLFMAIMLIMVILWVMYVFILSLVALNVIVILAPLFIPMVLFQHTKGYFDGWIKELITYSLYPVMLFAFLSFMFIACDKIFYGKLEFEEEQASTLLGQSRRWFKLQNSEACKERDNEYTLACMLQSYDWKKSSILGLFPYSYVDFDQPSDVVTELLKLALVLFLFYHFLGVLPGMAAELSGNYRGALGAGSTPQQTAGKAISLGRVAVGDAGQLAKMAAQKLQGATRSGGDGNKSGGSEKVG